MSPVRENIWFTGSGVETTFSDLVKTLRENTGRGTRVFIGTDSFISKREIRFASAICLHGEGVSRYFFTRNFEKLSKFKVLISRITEEVRRTVEIADVLYTQEDIDSNQIELHIDVSAFERKTKTSKFAEMLEVYVEGAGYTCKIKPDAWSSQTIADRHSK